MATHLSWTGYFLAVGAAVAIYYVIIGIRYYRQDIKALLNSKSRFWERPEKPPPPPKSNEEYQKLVQETLKPPAWQTQELFDKVEELSGQLKLSIAEARVKEYGKQDFIFLIKLLIKDFSAIKGTPFRETIDSVITSESGKYGFINLSAVELEELWKEV